MPSRSLRRTTWLVAVLAALVVIAGGVLGYPRIARRVWVLRNVDPAVRNRYLAIQEKLDAGGAWGTDEEACRFAHAFLVPAHPFLLPVKDESVCDACVVEIVRGANGGKIVQIYAREANSSPIIGMRYRDRVGDLIVGTSDPDGKWEVNDFTLYIEFRRDGRLESQYFEAIRHWWKRYVGRGYEGSSDSSRSIERMNIEHRLASPDPVFLPADAAPVGSRS
jgi:hypothetical protein